MRRLKGCPDGNASVVYDYVGLLCLRDRDATQKRWHYSQTSHAQSQLNPFYTCCWLTCTIPLFLPSYSSIPFLHLTCTRVRGNHHHLKGIIHCSTWLGTFFGTFQLKQLSTVYSNCMYYEISQNIDFISIDRSYGLRRSDLNESRLNYTVNKI